jgi:hypothetical protein
MGVPEEQAVGEVPSLCICPICTDILDGTEEASCTHAFCSACIRASLAISGRCPVCREPISADGLRQPHRALSALLEQVRVKCEWFELGCLEQLSLLKLAAHAARCEHNPHLCDGPGCVEANRRLLCRGCELRHYCSKACYLRHWE